MNKANTTGSGDVEEGVIRCDIPRPAPPRQTVNGVIRFCREAAPALDTCEMDTPLEKSGTGRE